MTHLQVEKQPTPLNMLGLLLGHVLLQLFVWVVRASVTSASSVMTNLTLLLLYGSLQVVLLGFC